MSTSAVVIILWAKRMTPTAIEKTQVSNMLRSFIWTTSVLKEIYDVTIYGKQHKEVNLLDKFGAKITASLSRKKLTRAVEQVNAMRKDDKLIHVTLEKKHVDLTRKILRTHLLGIRKIPGLAIIQLSVTLAANFEGYVADMIRLAFNTNHDTLKSAKSTLKDEELIEVLKSETIRVLIESRVRNIMYGSVRDWLNFLIRDLGFKINIKYDSEELFLIRNYILHNSGNIDRELQATRNNRYRRIGRSIAVTERDINRYLATTRENASAICREYIRKFCLSG